MISMPTPAYSSGDMIYTTPSVLINFECTYDNLYSGIEANDINVVGENVDADSEAGQGKFTFSQGWAIRDFQKTCDNF